LSTFDDIQAEMFLCRIRSHENGFFSTTAITELIFAEEVTAHGQPMLVHHLESSLVLPDVSLAIDLFLLLF